MKQDMAPSERRVVVAVLCGLAVASPVSAGVFIFADVAPNPPNIITHPATYTGTGGSVVVKVCIDPGSPNAAAMEVPLQNNINIYNRLQPTVHNIVLGSSNNIPPNFIDFESVLLHEIGHCLGLAHPNAATESGLAGSSQNATKTQPGANAVFDVNAGADGLFGSSDDLRGDDINVHWFQKNGNNPFTIAATVDLTTYSRDLTDLPPGDLFVVNGDRDVASDLGFTNRTEAVMQQGTFIDEAQRTLGHDDVATLRLAASGIDESAGTADDYTLTLAYGGISSASDCTINVAFSAAPDAPLAFCDVSGSTIGGFFSNNVRLTSSDIFFGSDFNWFFNTETVNQAPTLDPIDDQAATETDALDIMVNATDPDGDDVSLVATGLTAFMAFTDNGDGTGLLEVDAQVGDAGDYPITITAIDDGLPNVSSAVTFDVEINPLDSDGDGLGDNDEINVYGTNPALVDSDGDGLGDGDEVNTYGTDPLVQDTDGDGFSDPVEIASGSDPLLASSTPAPGTRVSVPLPLWSLLLLMPPLVLVGLWHTRAGTRAQGWRSARVDRLTP